MPAYELLATCVLLIQNNVEIVHYGGGDGVNVPFPSSLLMHGFVLQLVLLRRGRQYKKHRSLDFLPRRFIPDLHAHF